MRKAPRGVCCDSAPALRKSGARRSAPDRTWHPPRRLPLPATTTTLQTEKEKAKEEGKRAKAAQQGRLPASRAQRTARAFRYVWPESHPLQLRLVACFLLVLAERCVNLAVPVLYKHMVDDLGSAAAAVADNSGGGGSGAGGGSGGGGGWAGWAGWGTGGARAGALSEATRALMRAAVAAAGAGAEGEGEANGKLLAAAHGLLKVGPVERRGEWWYRTVVWGAEVSVRDGLSGRIRE